MATETTEIIYQKLEWLFPDLNEDARQAMYRTLLGIQKLPGVQVTLKNLFDQLIDIKAEIGSSDLAEKQTDFSSAALQQLVFEYEQLSTQPTSSTR